MQCTRTICLIHIVPSTLSTKDILNLLLLHRFALKVPLIEYILVGAGQALEAIQADVLLGGGVAGRHFGDAQHITAGGAD